MRRFLAVLLIAFSAAVSSVRAGDSATGYDVLAVIDHGDTIPFELLPIQFVYPNPVNTYDEKTRKFFWKTVRDVKKTLPYAKQIAAESAVLCGKIDAILLTGGMAHSDYLTGELRKRIDFLAPTYCFPGEDEMGALAGNAAAVLKGKREAKEYK